MGGLFLELNNLICSKFGLNIARLFKNKFHNTSKNNLFWVFFIDPTFFIRNSVHALVVKVCKGALSGIVGNVIVKIFYGDKPPDPCTAFMPLQKHWSHYSQRRWYFGQNISDRSHPSPIATLFTVRYSCYTQPARLAPCLLNAGCLTVLTTSLVMKRLSRGELAKIRFSLYY